MSIIGLLVFLIIIGVVLYLINSLIPMDPKIKTIINVLVVLFVVVWLLNATGILGSSVNFGHLR